MNKKLFVTISIATFSIVLAFCGILAISPETKTYNVGGHSRGVNATKGQSQTVVENPTENNVVNLDCTPVDDINNNKTGTDQNSSIVNNIINNNSGINKGNDNANQSVLFTIGDGGQNNNLFASNGFNNDFSNDPDVF